MYFSKHNIFSKIKDSENYFIINLLSGSADILNPEKAQEIIEKQYNDIEELKEKGYLADEEEENKLYKYKYFRFLDNRANDEIQIFFVPNYSCNFACSYCYQDDYQNNPAELTNEITLAFFDYIEKEFEGRKKYITIFGGEPLLPSEKQKENIQSFIQESKKRNISLAIVTNGYNLKDYIEILQEGVIREIQVTLDGTEEIHNKRRFLQNKNGTFNNIVEGIDSAIKNGFPINLRVVVDKENIHNLPDLADFAIKKGWTKSHLFKTQLGRNYELHHCQENNSRLFTRISLYEELYTLIKQYPQILEFHKPAFSVSKFIFENEELPQPLFDSCPACKTEWAFDYTGKIYSCTATVGKKGEELGTFYPEIIKKDHLISEWENRDIFSIQKCRDCSLQLACGGGCGAIAKNKTNTISSADCRPVKELLELGFGLYYKEE